MAGAAARAARTINARQYLTGEAVIVQHIMYGRTGRGDLPHDEEGEGATEQQQDDGNEDQGKFFHRKSFIRCLIVRYSIVVAAKRVCARELLKKTVNQLFDRL